jgi:transcriptional regulator with XRE-family HTH domain
MTIAEAVAEMRKRMGDTQEQFAARLGYAVRSVARYESNRPPKGFVLIRFARIAYTNGFRDVAEVFLGAIREETEVEAVFGKDGGIYLPGSTVPLADYWYTLPELPLDAPRTEQAFWTRVLEDVLLNAQPEVRNKVLRVLTRPAKQWLEKLRAEVPDAPAAEKLLRKGKQPAEVADLLDLDRSEVDGLWQWIQLSDAFQASAPKPPKKRR